MSYNYSSFGSLLSSSGANALASYTQNATYMNALSTVATDNSYTGTACGFNSSIFNISGYSTNTNSSSNNFTPYYPQTGNDGFNRRGAVNTNRSAIPQTTNPYSGGSYGSSIVGNYYTSIQSVELGQFPPMSVFEQRLNYHLDYSEQKNRPGSTLGDYSNYMNVDSVINNYFDSSSNYNVFSTNANQQKSAPKTSLANATTVSQLMSLLA